MATFRSYFESWAPSWLLAEYSGAFFGFALELVQDAVQQISSDAVAMAWLKDPKSPDDVLPMIGSERRMPQYPSESTTNYRDRLWHAWDAYEHGGSATAVNEQLAAAGFPGQVVYGGPMWQPDYYSQFWVFFPYGSHTVTSQGPAIGSFSVGDGTIIGPEGITVEQLYSLRQLIKKWKHSQWICRGLIFELSGWTIGTGHIIGEPGLVIGGETAFVGVP